MPVYVSFVARRGEPGEARVNLGPFRTAELWGDVLLATSGLEPGILATRLRGVYTLLRGKYYVDELYDFLVIRPFNALSRFAWRVVDDLLIDGLFVNGSGALVRIGSRVASGWESGYVQSYVLVFFGGVVLLLAYLLFGG